MAKSYIVKLRPFPDSLFNFSVEFSFAFGQIAVTFSSRQQILRENPNFQ